MSVLYDELRRLRESNVRELVESRLKEFKKVGSSSNERWFSELCYCILTANSKAKSAMKIQESLGERGFLDLDFEDLKKEIIRNNHRFPNTKATYIIDARQYSNIKEILDPISDSKAKREWLVSNIKGIGYKEASHFLRNVGFFDLAILDRHVLSLLQYYHFIKVPKSLNKKNYLMIESIMESIAHKVGMEIGELDLYMWYMKTGEVLK